MSIIGSVSGLFNRPLPSLDASKLDLSQIAPSNLPDSNALKTPITAGPSALSGANAIGSATAAPNSNFSSMFDKFVNGVDSSMKNADTEKAKVMTGESTNLHQAMIAMQEASTSFSLMVEVRNKLVDSYQELMRMQM